MKPVCLAWLGTGVFSIGALAQGSFSMPVAEVGFHFSHHEVTTFASDVSHQNGGSVYGQYFFKQTGRMWHGRSMLGVVAEFGGSGSTSGRLYTYLFGPRLSTEWRKSHLVLYAEYKIGGAHVRLNGVGQAGPDASVTGNSFAWGVAGLGLDRVIVRRYVMTLCQVDFVNLVPSVRSGSSHLQGEARISAGFGFRFGQR
jgi:hypothetical protein